MYGVHSYLAIGKRIYVQRIIIWDDPTLVNDVKRTHCTVIVIFQEYRESNNPGSVSLP